jgi:hypothetical protein
MRRAGKLRMARGYNTVVAKVKDRRKVTRRPRKATPELRPPVNGVDVFISA